jgi:hypothetical protein
VPLAKIFRLAGITSQRAWVNAQFQNREIAQANTKAETKVSKVLNQESNRLRRTQASGLCFSVGGSTFSSTRGEERLLGMG